MPVINHLDGLVGNAPMAAEQLVRDEENKRRHLTITLSGAHAYGFPSPDSDLDLKSIHMASPKDLLGLSSVPESFDRLEFIHDVEVDYTSNELRSVLSGILGGNGNYIERVLGHLIVFQSPELEQLRPLVQASLSQAVYRHYRGFAANQRRAFEAGEAPSAKRLLYVLRTALTGIHLLRAGELRVDLTTTAAEYGYGDAMVLIEAKKAGEQTVLSEALASHWRRKLDALFAQLDQALAASILPAEAPNHAALESWLLAVRKRQWSE